MKPLKLAFAGGGLNSVAGYTHFSASRMDHQFQVVTGVSAGIKTSTRTADFGGLRIIATVSKN